MILFLDTTYKLKIALLDQNYKCLKFVCMEESKASQKIHSLIIDIVTSHNLEMTSISQIVICAGPGFYTGLRLSQGIADILSFFNIPKFSFYSYDIPRLLGQESGIWVTLAYKKEVLICRWDKNIEPHIELIKQIEIEKKLLEYSQYSFYYPNSQMAETLKMKGLSTDELIEFRLEELIKNVILNKLNFEPFYFRPADQEFLQS